MKRVFLCILALACASSVAAEPALGQAPQPQLGARDVFVAFQLPPLKDAGGPLLQQTASLQVFRRARALGVNAGSALEAWTRAEQTLLEARARVAAPTPRPVRTFTGARLSELEALLRDSSIRAVRVASEELEADAPLLIRRAVSIDFGRAVIRGDGAAPYAVRVEGARDVELEGGRFSGGEAAVLIADSRNVTLKRTVLEGQRSGGVVVTGSQDVLIWESRFTGIAGAPVLLHGGTTGSVVAENTIERNVGSSNWHAGVVLSDRNASLAVSPLAHLNPDRFGVLEQPIHTRAQPPRHNVVAFNRIAMNRSSGVYVDGALQTVLASNTIEGNSKEGVCLDNGSTANVVAYNLIQQNGKRWGKTDADLQRDFVLGHGRLLDGSSPAKVPGISIDNAAYNLVYSNEVNRNYGGGIKMVRTAYFNVLGLNTLTDNNEGASTKFHFFGIELGAASADVPVPDLDFTASRGNIVFSNIIRGTHYAGVFFGPGSDTNDVFDNLIFGAKAWALESVSRQPNSSLNNLTNLPSRNVGAGLDPKLIEAAQDRLD